MELLLFTLAILFSVFSVLMERRKRRKRREEEQQHAQIEQQHAGVNPAAPVVVEEEKEEEPSFGWPFDGDPFDEPVPAEADPVASEREALEAERQALAAEQRAVAAEKRAMERLMETKPQDSGEKRRPRRSSRRTRSRWFLNPQTARDAIVYMEILGKPKSEREEE